MVCLIQAQRLRKARKSKSQRSKRNTPCANVHPEATCGMAYRSGLCGDVHLSLRHVFLGSAVPARAKGYSLIDAGFAMSMYPTAGLAGAILSGILSDKVFKGNRNIPNLLYGLTNIAGMCLMFFGPDNRVVDAVALSMIGFSIGGLVVFLAGLIACDLMPKTQSAQ